ncbi:GNAT family N-acetyltransferase [Rapidithrix thailandica]|uniref:GNAT family N-acetyltransferase n=1 Tax=Rapidithrix thailandica TaxID=413964 RepID=A0AAW9S136_9BACT
MKIIRATTDDLDHLTRLFDNYRQFYRQVSDLDGAKVFLKERITQLQSEIFIAYDISENGYQEGMGFIQLYPVFSSVSMKKLWLLNDLYVKTEYREQGVGVALLGAAKELARETGAKGLMLETECTNENAQRLYEKQGFKRNENFFYNFDI